MDWSWRFYAPGQARWAVYSNQSMMADGSPFPFPVHEASRCRSVRWFWIWFDDWCSTNKSEAETSHVDSAAWKKKLKKQWNSRVRLRQVTGPNGEPISLFVPLGGRWHTALNRPSVWKRQVQVPTRVITEQPVGRSWIWKDMEGYGRSLSRTFSLKLERTSRTTVRRHDTKSCILHRRRCVQPGVVEGAPLHRYQLSCRWVMAESYW